MSEKHEHHREDDDDRFEHYRADAPSWFMWASTFINRTGFPIFAFCILAYFAFVTLNKNTQAINDLKEVVISLRAGIR